MLCLEIRIKHKKKKYGFEPETLLSLLKSDIFDVEQVGLLFLAVLSPDRT